MHNESNVFLTELDYIASHGFTVALILNTQYVHHVLPGPSHHLVSTNATRTNLNHLSSDGRQTELQCFHAQVKFSAFTRRDQLQETQMVNILLLSFFIT